MNSLWSEEEVRKYGDDPLGLRVYTSQLLGRESSLVLHGGGNTSVKARMTNIFGESEEVLYIKGSGWDLATIEQQGFAPVKMDVLQKMARLPHLSDSEMVRVQRSAMTDPSAPTPSVEAILHAIIPFAYVDHTHADAVVTITNTGQSEHYIREIYQDRVLIVPYVMPGFMLARKVHEMTKGIDWKKVEAIILMNHGVFTFDDSARASYERMISIVSEAEKFLMRKGVTIFGHRSDKTAVSASVKIQSVFARIQNLIRQKAAKRENPPTEPMKDHLLKLAELRRLVSRESGIPVLARQKSAQADIRFSMADNIASLANRGPLTPDHVIRTKRIPVVIGAEMAGDIKRYAEGYRRYFQQYAGTRNLTCLDQAPRWAVWPGCGLVCFGRDAKEIRVISDIVDHTVWAIEAAERFDRWTALQENHIFDVEYWELEQAKLSKKISNKQFEGKIALITGAASGIGRACVDLFRAQGAAVSALDLNPKVEELSDQDSILGLRCDVTHESELQKAVETTVAQFGGLDILVSNAGIFPVGETIEHLQPGIWDQSMDVNLSSHYRLFKKCIPYLAIGIDPTIIVIASKNVPAPGPGASAYSVAKAGLTQLARIAAMELGHKGIRVNVIHPNQVFDTAIWTPEVLEQRAKQYGMSVDDYKIHNLLHTEITSRDVAQLVTAIAGPAFAKTTGAQVPIDGGNERVI